LQAASVLFFTNLVAGDVVAVDGVTAVTPLVLSDAWDAQQKNQLT
jgi:hypothetical protein